MIPRPKFDPLARFRVLTHRGIDMGDRIIPEGKLIPEGALDHMQLLALYCSAAINPIAPDTYDPEDEEETDEPPVELEHPDAKPVIKSKRRRAA